MTRWLSRTTLSIAALGLALVGCSDGDDPGAEVDCGPGTELNDDGTACQPGGDGGLDCGPGTEANADATACVPDSEACGPDTTLVDGRCQADAALECGANTVDDQGRCVPTDGTCAPGTRFDEASGTCQPDASTCGPDTTFDPDTSTCAPGDGLCPADQTWDAATSACVPASDIACGPDTIDDGSGTCVPDGDALCGTGASLDDATGQCVADVVCGEGTVAHEGVCVLPTDMIASDPSTVTESTPDDNDPNNGTPESLAMPTLGNSSFFTGTIEARANQDLDAWTFTASAGDYVHIQVMATGELAMGYRITGPDDYVRWSPLFTGDGAARSLLLPWDGEYHIEIAPQAVLDSNVHSDLGLLGSDTASYVGALELRDLPAANALAADTPLDGEFSSLDQNLVQLQGAAGDVFELSLDTDGAADVQPAIVVLDDTGTPVFESPIYGAMPYQALDADDGARIFIEYQTLRGSRDDFTFELGLADGLVAAGALGSDSSVTVQSPQVEAHEPTFVSFSVSPGEVVHLTTDGFVELNGWRHFPARYDAGFGAWRLFSVTGGHYVAAISPASFEGGSVETTLTTYTPVSMGTVDLTNSPTASGSSGALAPGEFIYYAVTAADQMLFTTLADVDDNGRINVRSFNERLDFVHEARGTATGEDLTSGPYLVAAGSTQLIEVSSNVDAVSALQVDVSTAAAPPTEVEPNNSPTDAASSANTLIPGTPTHGVIDTSVWNDVDYFELTVGPGEQGVYAFELTDTAGFDREWLQLRNASDEAVSEAWSEVYHTAGSYLEPGTWYLRIEAGGWDPGLEYLVSAERIDVSGANVFLDVGNNDTQATATPLTPSDSFLLTGVVAGSADVDVFEYTPSADVAYQVWLNTYDGQVAPLSYAPTVVDAAGTELPLTGLSVYELQGGTTYYLSSVPFRPADRNTYAYDFRRVTELGVVGTVTATSEPLDSYYAFNQVFELPADQFIQITASDTLGGPLSITVRAVDRQTIIAQDTGLPQGGTLTFHSATEQVVEVSARLTSAGTSTYTVTTSAHPTVPIGSVASTAPLAYSGGALAAGQTAFYEVTVSDAVDTTLTVRPDAAGTVEVTALVAGQSAAGTTVSSPAPGAAATVDLGVANAGDRVVLAVTARNGAIASHQVDVSDTVVVPSNRASDSPALFFGYTEPVEPSLLLWPTVPGCTIASLVVEVDISHAYIGDITATLHSPSGTSVVLHNGTGGSADNIVGTYPTTLTPAQSLATLVGETAAGDWRLSLSDSYPLDGGTLNSWAVEVTCQ